jgi:hypothetical protein
MGYESVPDWSREMTERQTSSATSCEAVSRKCKPLALPVGLFIHGWMGQTVWR